MAWHTVQATDDLLIELCPTGEALGPGPKDRADKQPLLKIRSKATESEVVVYLDEVRHLVDALAEAAAGLAAAEDAEKDRR